MKKLWEGKDNIRVILEQLILKDPTAIAIFDSEGHYIASNRAYIDLFKITPPKDYSIFADPIVKKRGIISELINSIRKNRVYEIPELWYNTKDVIPEYPDNEICIKITIVPIIDGMSEPKYIFIRYEDITQVKLTKRELEKEREILNNIIELNPYAMQIFDDKGNCIGTNKALKNLYLSAPGPDYNFLEDPIHQKTGAVKMFKKAMDGEIVYAPENWYNPNDLSPDLPDKLVCQNAVLFPTFDSKDNIQKIVVMYEDITERKLAQKKLQELKEQLEHRVKERTLLLENSEKKFRQAYKRANCYKGLFTHDVSNIFQIFSNSLELLREMRSDRLAGEEKEIFDAMEAHLTRGKKLIYNIRNLSELEETEIPIVPTNIKPYLNEAIEFLKANFQQKDIEISIKVGNGQYQVLANGLLLDVFENILINAIRYNNEAKIKIQVNISQTINKEQGKFIQIEFKDNGIGISEERKKIIFQDGQNIQKGGKGMGLGLSLVSKLLELCEGKIWVEDRIPGDYSKGSNFIIQIPEAI